MTEEELQRFEEKAKTFDKEAELLVNLLIAEIRVLDAKWKAQGLMIQNFHHQEANLISILKRANECYVNNEDMLVNVNIVKALGELGVIK